MRILLVAANPKDGTYSYRGWGSYSILCVDLQFGTVFDNIIA
jgi:hypothetical protein